AEEGAEDADRIDAGVMPEPRVLGDDHGVLQRLRDLVQRDRQAVLELLAEDRREELRLERGVARGDALDGVAAKGDVYLLRRIAPRRMREGAREDVDPVPAGDVVARLRERRRGAIAEAVEFLEEIVR